MTKGLDQYHQEAEQLWELEDNYFDATTRSTNTSPILEVEDKEDDTQNKDNVHVKQQLFNSKESTDNILESPVEDTGNPLQQQRVLTSTVQT